MFRLNRFCITTLSDWFKKARALCHSQVTGKTINPSVTHSLLHHGICFEL